MQVSPTVHAFLERQHIPYHLLHHSYSETAMSSAIAAGVPTRCVGKGVVLCDDEGFVMAVVPSHRMVDIDAINLRMNRNLQPAAQRDINILFRDCDKGAVPALGQAYNMPVIWDEHLADEQECFLECGMHTELMRLDKDTFLQLMGELPHGMISH